MLHYRADERIIRTSGSLPFLHVDGADRAGMLSLVMFLLEGSMVTFLGSVLRVQAVIVGCQV